MGTQSLGFDSIEWQHIELTRGLGYGFGAESCIRDKTTGVYYLAYRGPNSDFYIVSWNPANGDYVGPVKVLNWVVGPEPYPGWYANDRSDGHGQAFLAIDGNGYIHMIGMGHNSPITWAKSGAPRNILATWTTNYDAIPALWGTYLSLCYHAPSTAIYGFLRTNPNWTDIQISDPVTHEPHGNTYPNHEFGTLIKLADGGASWTDLGASTSGIIDTSANPSTHNDVYSPVLSPFGNDLLLTWNISEGTTHDDHRVDAYAVKFRPSDSHLYTMGGTDLGLNVNWTDHASCIIYAKDIFTPDGVSGTHSVPFVTHAVNNSGDRAVVALTYAEDASHGNVATVYWNGSSWTTGSLPGWNNLEAANLSIRYTGNGWELMTTTMNFDSGVKTRGERWISSDGTTWVKDCIVVPSNRVRGVYGPNIIQRTVNGDEHCPWIYQPYWANPYDPSVQILGLTRSSKSKGRAVPPAQGARMDVPFEDNTLLNTVLSPTYSANTWYTEQITGDIGRITAVDLIVGVSCSTAYGQIEFRLREKGTNRDADVFTMFYIPSPEFGNEKLTVQVNYLGEFEWRINKVATDITLYMFLAGYHVNERS